MVFMAETVAPVPTKDLLSWIFDDLAYDGDRPVYIDAVDPSRSLSANESRVIIRKLIAGLRALGVRPGQKDVVCVQSFNDIMYPMLFLSIIGAGGIFAGTNPSYTPYELVHHIKTSETRYIITEPEMLTPMISAAKDCGILPSNILILNVRGQAVPNGFSSWETLLSHGQQDWVRFNDLATAKQTEAARLFSSGTTGLPKAAILSHHNLVAQHTLLHHNDEPPFEPRRLLCLPMFHAAMVPLSHTSALKGGSTNIVMRRFELEPFLANVEIYAINDLLLVPPLIIAIMMSPLSKNYDLTSIKNVRCGAAPLGAEPQRRFQKMLADGASVTQVLGLTEASCLTTKFQYLGQDDTGSVGMPLPNLDIKLIDDSGNDTTAYNTNGELCIRGPTIVAGYLNNPAANADSFDSDGFYHTGDIGYCDSKSKLWYIVDRKKELIKVRAFQVAPPEIEAVLLSHPLIIDAAVIGVSDGSEGQIPRAYVVRRAGKEGRSLREHDVKDCVEKKLAKYKRLDGGVRFVETIPRNASGKILKRILKEQARSEEKARL